MRSCSTLRTLTAALALGLLATPAQAATWLGTVGDSLSEPYQEIAPFTWDGFLRSPQPGWPFLGDVVPAVPMPENWTDQLINNRAGELSVDNYALGGRNSTNLLSEGQHTAAAAEAATRIAAGDDAFITVGIGTNNIQPFAFPGLTNTYGPISANCAVLTACTAAFTGTNGVSYTNVETYLADVMAEFSTALSVVEGSGANVVVLGAMSWGRFPGVESAFQTPSATVDAAIELLVDLQRAEAAARGLPFVDLYALQEAFETLEVGGLDLLPGAPAFNTRNALTWFLPDSIHPDTVASGLINNAVIAALNSQGAGLTPFGDDEILALAGLTPDAGWDGSDVDISPYVSLVPEPSSLVVLGLVGLALRRRPGSA